MTETQQLEPLSSVFSGPEQVRRIAEQFSTPVFVYSQQTLEQQAQKALDFPNAYGLTVRYAMKANSNINILRIFDRAGLHIDASSGFEAQRAMHAGVAPDKILITAQEIPDNLKELVEQGVNYNACSLHQLETYGKMFPSSKVSVRINPGLGSGESHTRNTGGPAASFGIWHKHLDKVFDIARRYSLDIIRIHTHIGSGSNPVIWQRVALMSFNIVEKFLNAGYDIEVLNLGGGYKVGRMSYERSTDLQECGKPVKQAFMDFEERTGKRLRLEIEPGTYLVANAGAVVARVIDLKSTDTYNHLVVDSGMTEVTRPQMYGAQHPITIVPIVPIDGTGSIASEEVIEYNVCGKCCESGDSWTPAKGDPEKLKPRKLLRAEIDDFLVIGGAGAYCSSMCTKNYNSFPRAAEVLIDKKGKLHLIKQRQSLQDVMRDEIPMSLLE